MGSMRRTSVDHVGILIDNVLKNRDDGLISEEEADKAIEDLIDESNYDAHLGTLMIPMQ